MALLPDRIDVNYERRPLIVATFFGSPTDQQFAEYLEALAKNLMECIRTGKKTALLLDTTYAPIPASAGKRKQQADWLEKYSRELGIACVGTAFVIQSTLVRGAMTAVFWLQRLPYPHTVAASYEQGEAWCIEQLAASGLSVQARGQQGPPVMR